MKKRELSIAAFCKLRLEFYLLTHCLHDSEYYWIFSLSYVYFMLSFYLFFFLISNQIRVIFVFIFCQLRFLWYMGGYAWNIQIFNPDLKKSVIVLSWKCKKNKTWEWKSKWKRKESVKLICSDKFEWQVQIVGKIWVRRAANTQFNTFRLAIVSRRFIFFI